MDPLKNWLSILLLSIGGLASAQGPELISLLNEGTCATCDVATNCQPHPLAGTSGHTDLGYSIEDIWGVKHEVTIAGRIFYYFNTTEYQRQMLTESLEILPQEYIEMLPKNFRVGNPNRPYGMTSSGRQIGGSKFCMPYDEDNLQFESIVLHEAIFTINNKKHRTILHECGHFFSRKFDVFDSMTPAQRDSSSYYLANVYHGRTSSHDETIAQCFMFFFHQMYFNRNERLPVPKTFAQIVPQPARKFKRWMCDFIKNAVQDTSSF